MKSIDDFAPWPTPGTGTARDLARHAVVSALYSHGRMQAPDVSQERDMALTLNVVHSSTIARLLQELAQIDRGRADQVASELLEGYEHSPAPLWAASEWAAGYGLDPAEITAAGTAAEEHRQTDTPTSRAVRADLDPVRRRAAKYANHPGTLRCCNAHDTADDVPGLLAEIDRLTAERDQLRAQIETGSVVDALTRDETDHREEQLRARADRLWLCWRNAVDGRVIERTYAEGFREDAAAAWKMLREGLPMRGDRVEVWLKNQRDAATGHPAEYNAADGLLDLYRLHADTGTPLGQHACEGRCADCASGGVRG